MPVTVDPVSGRSCAEIVGLDNVVLSFDGGKTLVQSKTPRVPEIVVFGLAPLGTPLAMAALVGRYCNAGLPCELFTSVDGGCHWANRGKIEASALIEGRGGLAYAWGGRLYAVTAEGARTLKSPPGWIARLAVDPSREKHLRTVGNRGIFDSVDGGTTWRKVGDAGSLGSSPEAAINSSDVNHIAVRLNGDTFRSTRDGGHTWVSSKAKVPGDGSGLVLSTGGQIIWSFGTEFFRSTDGGASFVKLATPVPTGCGRVILLGAQPDPNIFVFAGNDEAVHTRFILRFDAGSLESTKQALPLDPGEGNGYDVSAREVITAGTFVPGEPSAFCLGIASAPAWKDPS
jgi:hypothetical protein